MKKIMTICSALVALSFTVFISASKAEDTTKNETAESNDFSNIPRSPAPGADPNTAVDTSGTEAGFTAVGEPCKGVCLKNARQGRMVESYGGQAPASSGAKDSSTPSSTSSPEAGTR